jgi:short-subunit dehydrogenase
MSEKKILVITGASAGIGAALARCLAEEGHSLALVARREKELDAVGTDAQRLGASAVACIVADVTRRDDVVRIARETIERFGRFDVWVNNAGRGITRDVLDLTDADIDEMIAINIKSALYGMQVAAKHFLERGAGQIVNVSSFLGRVPLASYRSAYSGAKAMLNSLTANLRMDLAAKSPDIRVTLVMPGVVTTDFSRNVVGEARAPLAGGKGPPSQTPEEVAKVVAAVIRSPVAEVYTNPASAPTVKAYQEDIVAFEARLRAP